MTMLNNAIQGTDIKPKDNMFIIEKQWKQILQNLVKILVIQVNF